MLRRSPAPAALLFLIFLAATAAGQEADTKGSEPKEITGRVVSDSGQPLAGAIVSAGRAAGPASQRTATDNEGNFRIQGLDSGFYRIFASLPGYVTQFGTAEINNPTTFYRPGDSISLTLIKGGVISGIVTSMSGEPVVNLSVRALRIRDADGEKVQGASSSANRMTDDRGYYRLYGLQPGTYIVYAGGQAQYFGVINPFANDAPTFAPASTRDTAAEFVVRADQEVTADIRYRGEPGHAVSGRIIGGAVTAAALPGVASSVRIIDVETRMMLAGAPALGEDRTFQINGVSDGEYEISAIAVTGGPGSDMNASQSRRISVKGADVTGIELTLTPMASITGRVNLELDEKLKCGRRRDNALRETMITVRRERAEEKPAGAKTDTANDSPSMFPGSMDSVPGDKGEVTFRNLAPANYRFEIRLPGAGWYAKDLSVLSADARNKAPASNIPKNGIAVKAGDRISGLTVTIVEGGAGFRGRVNGGEGQSLPPGLHVYLVPAERESLDNILRFFEGPVDSEGKFAIGNIAPGKYWLIAQPLDAAGKTPRSIRTDSPLRSRVLRSAETLKKEIIFKPCDRTIDYELALSPASKVSN